MAGYGGAVAPKPKRDPVTGAPMTDPTPQAPTSGYDAAMMKSTGSDIGTVRGRKGIFGQGAGPVESKAQFDPYAAQLTDFSGRYGDTASLAQRGLAENRSDLRSAQMDQARQSDYLQRVQMGAAPSVAASQQRAGLDEAQRNAMALAITGRGGPAAQIQAQQAQRQMAMQGVNQAAQLRAQEMAQGRADYSAALGQQATMAGMGQEMIRGGTQDQLALIQAEQQGELGQQGLQADSYNAAMQANAQIAQANLASAAAELENKRARRHDTMKSIGSALTLGMMK